jgi:hypothetical protein
MYKGLSTWNWASYITKIPITSLLTKAGILFLKMKLTPIQFQGICIYGTRSTVLTCWSKIGVFYLRVFLRLKNMLKPITVNGNIYQIKGLYRAMTLCFQAFPKPKIVWTYFDTCAGSIKGVDYMTLNEKFREIVLDEVKKCEKRNN